MTNPNTQSNNKKNDKNNMRYGQRILAANIQVSNDTRISGLNNNDIICGNSGCGKTGGYVVPNLQNIDGSLIVSDTKGLLEKRFRRELQAKGYRVYTLDLVNPMRSCGYNPMAAIRRHPDGSYREQDVLTLAKLICPMRDKKDPFWDLSAADYVAFLIAYCLETEPKQNQNLIRVAELHRAYIQPNGDTPFGSWANKHPKSFAAKKYQEFAMTRNVERTFSCIMAFVNVNLAQFAFKESQHIFANPNSFDIRELGRRKTVLFLNISDTNRACDQIVNIFHSQALQLLCAEADANPNGRLRVPVRLIMDDFAAGTVIPDFDKTISVIRSRDISVSLIIQSLSQLESMYDWAVSRTILNNCDHILYMGSQDLDTANYLAARAGKTPEAILSMPRNKVYLITAGEKARLVDKIAPYSTLPQTSNKEEIIQQPA